MCLGASPVSLVSHEEHTTLFQYFFLQDFFSCNPVTFFICCMLQIITAASGKESICPCRSCKRCRFDPWVGKIPWRKKWQPTPVFLPGKSHRQVTVYGVAERWTRLKQMRGWYGPGDGGWCIYTVVLSRVHVSESPWIAAHQPSLSMKYSRQEYCSGLPHFLL